MAPDAPIAVANAVKAIKSFFIDEFMLTRRNLRLKSAVDPKMLRHAITAIYREEDPRISKIIKAVKARKL